MSSVFHLLDHFTVGKFVGITELLLLHATCDHAVLEHFAADGLVDRTERTTLSFCAIVRVYRRLGPWFNLDALVAGSSDCLDDIGQHRHLRCTSSQLDYDLCSGQVFFEEETGYFLFKVAVGWPAVVVDFHWAFLNCKREIESGFGDG